MTVSIDIPDEWEEPLNARALAEGLSAEQFARQILERELRRGDARESDLQTTDPEEWGRRFQAWAESHDPHAPVLSDEAMSRETIYRDLG